MYPALCAVPSSTPMVRESPSIGPPEAMLDSPQSFVPSVDNSTPPHEINAVQISADERLALSLQEEEDRIAAAEMVDLPAGYEWMYHDGPSKVQVVEAVEEEFAGSGQSTPRASPTGHLVRAPVPSRVHLEQMFDNGRPPFTSQPSSEMSESTMGSSGMSVAMSRSSGACSSMAPMRIPSSPRLDLSPRLPHLGGSISWQSPGHAPGIGRTVSSVMPSGSVHRGGGLAPAAMIESWVPTSPRPRHRVPRPSSGPASDTPISTRDSIEKTSAHTADGQPPTPIEPIAARPTANDDRLLPSPQLCNPLGHALAMPENQATLAAFNRIDFASDDISGATRPSPQAALILRSNHHHNTPIVHAPPPALHASRRRRADSAPAGNVVDGPHAKGLGRRYPPEPPAFYAIQRTPERQQQDSLATESSFRYIKMREETPQKAGRNTMGSVIRARQTVKRKQRDPRNTVMMPPPGAALLVPPGEHQVSPEPQNDDDVAHLPLVGREEVSTGVLARARRLQEVMRDGTGPGILVTPPTPQQLREQQEREETGISADLGALMSRENGSAGLLSS